MPFDTDTTSKGSIHTSKGSMDGSKVLESCPESQVPAAEASFQSEDILDKLFPKYQQCKTGKMGFGAWFHLKEVTDREATTKFKSRATKFYKSVSDMAIPGLHAQEYRDDHYTASKNYAKIQDSAIFSSVKSSVKSEMKDDFQAASCFAFRQICGPDLSLPDTAKMREHAAEYMGNSDIIKQGFEGSHGENMTNAFLEARKLASRSVQATVLAETRDGSSNESSNSPQTSIASNNTLKPE